MTLANDIYAADSSAPLAIGDGRRTSLAISNLAVQGAIGLLAVATALALYRHLAFAGASAAVIGMAIGAILLLIDGALRTRPQLQIGDQRVAALEARMRQFLEGRTADPAGAAAGMKDLQAAKAATANTLDDGSTAARPVAASADAGPIDFDAYVEPSPADAAEDHDAAVDDLVRRLAEGFDADPAALDAVRSLAPSAHREVEALPRAAAQPAAPVAPKLRHRALQDVDEAPAAAVAAAEPKSAARSAARSGGPISRIGDPELASAIERAISDGEVDLYLQPIARLGDRKARFYEVFPRLKSDSGEPIKPAEYQPAAQFAGRASDLEEAILTCSLDLLQKLSGRGKAKPFFFTLSRTALADIAMRERIMTLLTRHSGLVEYLVLELAEADLVRFGRLEQETLGLLGDAGLVFAMRNPESLDLDLDWLRDRRFAFVKAPASLPLSTNPANADLGARLGQAGLQLIVEDIADEIAFAHAQSIGAVLGQGALFSEPRPVRPELLA